jgi:hypothetical protein
MAQKKGTSKKLYDLLISRGFMPTIMDADGKELMVPDDAELFSFDFKSETGNDYGTVVVLLGAEQNMDVFFADNVGKSMEGADKEEWFDFLLQLRMFAKRNLLSYGIKNINQLRYSLQGQAALKEGLFESWHGNKTTSYNADPNAVRLMIRHNKPIGEGDLRHRYVESLFLETAEGERFKLPFTRLSGGRAMMEHVRQGGKPYDQRGQHIAELVNEMNALKRFGRMNIGKICEGEIGELVKESRSYYESIKSNLHGIGTRRGYSSYFESWDPSVVTEQDLTIEKIRESFITDDIDSRVSEALPVLAKIQKQRLAMKEADIFESWVHRIAEARTMIPHTREQQHELVELLSSPMIVGPDATNATEQLYDLLASDSLFAQLADLAEVDPNADARPIVLSYMGDHSENLNIKTVLAQLHPESEEDGTNVDNGAGPKEPVTAPNYNEQPPEAPEGNPDSPLTNNGNQVPEIPDITGGQESPQPEEGENVDINIKEDNDIRRFLNIFERESTETRDERAEKAGRKVRHDIEYDEGHKGKDDNKAEKAGKKVTKDIEWDEKHNRTDENVDIRDIINRINKVVNEGLRDPGDYRSGDEWDPRSPYYEEGPELWYGYKKGYPEARIAAPYDLPSLGIRAGQPVYIGFTTRGQGEDFDILDAQAVNEDGDVVDIDLRQVSPDWLQDAKVSVSDEIEVEYTGQEDDDYYESDERPVTEDTFKIVGKAHSKADGWAPDEHFTIKAKTRRAALKKAHDMMQKKYPNHTSHEAWMVDDSDDFNESYHDEQLDELSKDTLKSYAKKAKSSLGGIERKVGRDMTKANNSHDSQWGDEYVKQVKKGLDKAGKREKGIDRALDRLEESGDLERLLNLSGVEPQNNPAPDYQDPTQTYPDFATEDGAEEVVIATEPTTEPSRLNPEEYDNEGSYAKGQIHSIVRNAKELEQSLGDQDNLPEWLQAKLERTHSMMQSVNDYIQSNRERKVEKDHGIEGFTTSDILDGFEDEMDEGAIGQSVGTTAGTAAGRALGSATPLGPVGGAIGGWVGGKLGGIAGDKIGNAIGEDNGDLAIEESQLSMSRLQTLAGFIVK